MSRNIGVIVAAGKGLRSGFSEPKQFVRLLGKPVLLWSVDCFLEHPAIEEVIVVAASDYIERIAKLVGQNDKLTIVPGGAERADSVRAALNRIGPANDSDTRILIHDAARPGITTRIIHDLIDALDDVEAAAPALEVADALKREAESELTSVDRSNLYRVQTPQAFRYDAIKAAHSELSTQDLVDDLEAAQASGLKVKLISGEERLMKLTFPKDFEVAEKLLSLPSLPRIGMGYDVHAFEAGSSVHLCGVEIAHSAALKGHSDADVAWHALTDAILGALAEGDIGDHFPPSDPQWKGEPSITFLAHANSLAQKAGYVLSNVDITLICEAPKIKPHRDKMRIRTAEVLGIPVERVSVKATTTEGLGYTGRQEGIASQACVILVGR